jgi:hypothetical protein
MDTYNGNRNGSENDPETGCMDCSKIVDWSPLRVEEIMRLSLRNRIYFSLKAYAAAYHMVMEAATGDAQGQYASDLLEMCADRIARGHTIELR